MAQSYEELQAQLIRLKRKVNDTIPGSAEEQELLEQIKSVEVQLRAAETKARTQEVVSGEETQQKVFHNLPQPDYGKFIGREQELATIIKNLRPYPHSRHFVITIDGIGGIGKSALALEIAHRYLHNYDQLDPEDRFDAIIWTSAKQTVLTAEGIRPRRQVLHTLQDIYTAIAVALQREDITRANAEEQDSVVTRALTQQRTLLLVDNLETVDDEAVLDFLRELPAPTKAIVTTRHRIDVAYPVRLTGMPWEDAQQLIAQECEKKAVSLNEDAMRRLFDRTGGVPLAIVWSIAQMGFGYSPDAVLTRLGQPSGDIARFCFEGAIARIKGKPAHKLLMVLSLCADSASREALGYATELPELDRDDGLVVLEKLSLVNKKGDRFKLLPLTKQFAAAEFQKSPDKEHLREKWVEYFRMLSEEYSSEYWNWTNYDWVLAEGNNILSIIDLAATVGHGEVALSFARGIKLYLDVKGNRSNLFDYGEKLYNIAQSLHDKRTCAWICTHWLAWLYEIQKNPERAETFANRGLSLYRDLDDTKGLCLAMSVLGRILLRAARYEWAEEILDQAINLAREHGYGDGIAHVHFNLGRLRSELGEWGKSKIHWEAAIEWCEKHEDEADLDISFLMAAFEHLGWVEFHLGNYRHGRELMEQSLEFYERRGGRVHTTRLRLRLAIIENALRNREKALQHVQEVLSWAERLGMKQELEDAKKLLEELKVNQSIPI